jgi:hypothetical protein
MPAENRNPARNFTGPASEVFSVHEKGRKSIITDMDEESQGIIDFGIQHPDDIEEVRGVRAHESRDADNPASTLRKVKHMQNLIKKEGLSNQAMKDNIDSFEDVPAYIRRNMIKGVTDPASESKLSKFTLSTDRDEPVLRENNAYLNDNVD